MSMRDTYQAAIAACKGHMEGNAEERDGKLYFKGTVGTEEEKNRIWDAIKTVPTWQNDVVADIRVQPKAGAASGGASAAAKTYTVAAGDTLSKIAQQTLGDAKQYMKIFEANRDQLSDPDKIRPGQVLKIPA
jgi:nucleoid-associated protein YgaU